MEHVITKINEEVQEFAHKTAKSVDELTENTKKIKDDIVNRTQPKLHFGTKMNWP